MTAKHSSRISVIIVNYGTAELAIEAVESVLEKSHGGRLVDVHLVDNASPGNDAAVFRNAHAGRGWENKVTLYIEGQNHGFGRGNNLVLRALAKQAQPPDYVMLLNPDARLKNDAIEIMARFLDTHESVGFVGAGICKPDGQPVTAAFRFPNAIAEFSSALNFGPVARALKRFSVPLPPDQPTGPVDWVSGAAVMMRFDLGGFENRFDPNYFLYFEEVDLMFRARQVGIQTWFLPQAHVVHYEGVSTGVKSGQSQRERKPPYWYDSWYLFYARNRGRTGVFLAGLAWAAGAMLNYPIAIMRGQTLHAPLGFFGDFWAGPCRRFMGLGRKT